MVHTIWEGPEESRNMRGEVEQGSNFGRTLVDHDPSSCLLFGTSPQLPIIDKLHNPKGRHEHRMVPGVEVSLRCLTFGPSGRDRGSGGDYTESATGFVKTYPSTVTF